MAARVACEGVSGYRMKPAPVTRSKGGWRRKPRRITPFVIENYWPGTQRLATLRRMWPMWKPNWMIVDAVNRWPAPRAVTVWQCKLMASHLKLRRPRNIGAFTRACQELGPETTKLRLRYRSSVTAFVRIAPAQPERASKLRKVGRKPKPKALPGDGRLFATGLSMGRSPRAVLTPAEVRSKEIKRRNIRIRAIYRHGTDARTLAKRFGLSHHTIYTICEGARRKKPPANSSCVRIVVVGQCSATENEGSRI